MKPEVKNRNSKPLANPARTEFGFSNLIGVSAFIKGFGAILSLPDRLRRARPGSVLIIVIVLLLLLAILGAAYISTTRSARVSSAQNVLNSDLDAMMNGVAKVCEGVIVDDLNDTFGNLRGNSANTANTTNVVTRSLYQGEAGSWPPIDNTKEPAIMSPAALAGAYNSATPAYQPSYFPGDIVKDISAPGSQNPMLFYTVPPGVTIPGGIPLSITNGWQPLNGHLPVSAIGSDPWLADRIPDPDGSVGAAVWHNLTQSIGVVGSTPVVRSIFGTQFENPITGIAIPDATWPSAPMQGFVGQAFPTAAKLSNGSYVPALTVNGTSLIAADADGDGTADSFLFRIPGMNVDGLTWYTGVRIIDNNSAINANTAWSSGTGAVTVKPQQMTGGGTDIWNLTQANVGLAELISTATVAGKKDSVDTLNTYRFNGQTLTAQAFDESPVNGNAPPKGQARADFTFSSAGEAFYEQVIRRLANPGYIANGTRFQALPLSDEASLAHNFCLANAASSTPQTSLESIFPNSLWNGAASSPYYPNGSGAAAFDNTGATAWFNANFNYGSGNSTLPIRALLVTSNPVSNYIEPVYNNNSGASPNASSYITPGPATQPSISDPILPNYMLPYSGPNNPHFKGNWDPTVTYGLNDIVVAPDTNYGAAYSTYAGPQYTFIAVSPSGPSTAGGAQLPATVNTVGNNVLNAVNQQYWQLQPWSVNPVKTNVNTATFRELFRAFWCVMAGNPSNSTPFGATPPDWQTHGIYDNSPFNPQHQFRSPLRDPTTTQPTLAAQLDGSASTQPSGTATNTNTMLLRAAIAAVNALGLRDNSQNVISKTIILNNAFVANTLGGAPTNQPVEVRVYSNAPQPFISEVYVDNYTGPDPSGTLQNPSGYVAIELFNPYSVDLKINNWQIAYINRPASGAANPAYPGMSVTPVATTLPSFTIKAGRYALLENYNATQPSTQPATTQPAVASDAQYRNGNSGLSSATTLPSTNPSDVDVYVPGLSTVYGGALGASITDANGAGNNGGELVLLRPRRADGVLSSYVDLANDPGHTGAPGSESFNETTNVWDLVPVDSYDFTGFPVAPPSSSTTGPWTFWSYLRAKGSTNLFKATYPGRYDASSLTGITPRQDGTGVAQAFTQAQANGSANSGGPTTSPSGLTWASASSTPGFFQTVGSSYTYYQTGVANLPVQIYNVSSNTNLASLDWMHFPNAVISPQNPAGMPAGTVYQHPYGAFARNGDMLDIPFIGAYRIRLLAGASTSNGFTLSNAGYSLANAANPGVVLELNSLPMDCQCAAIDAPVGAASTPFSPAENIGRFVPMAASATYTNAIQTLRGGGSAGALTPPLPDFYSWTRNLFNYLTVQTGTDAFTPGADPNVTAENQWAPTNTGLFAYPPQNTGTPTSPPAPTLTADPTVSNQTSQDRVGVEGLININTASWKVLSMLPMVPGNTAQNEALAKAIVTYRETYGPFTSIFDLNQVPGFQTAQGTITVSSAGSTASSSTGLLSPADPAFGTTTALSSTNPLGGVEDYQSDCLELTRISNLITTRSDTFTVYIVLQGWQNVGTANAQPVITRRYSFIVDRSAINADPTSRYLKTLTVPNN